MPATSKTRASGRAGELPVATYRGAGVRERRIRKADRREPQGRERVCRAGPASRQAQDQRDDRKRRGGRHCSPPCGRALSARPAATCASTVPLRSPSKPRLRMPVATVQPAESSSGGGNKQMIMIGGGVAVAVVAAAAAWFFMRDPATPRRAGRKEGQRLGHGEQGQPAERRQRRR